MSSSSIRTFLSAADYGVSGEARSKRRGKGARYGNFRAGDRVRWSASGQWVGVKFGPSLHGPGLCTWACGRLIGTGVQSREWEQAYAVNATSDPPSHHDCSGGARITVVAALVVWSSRSLRGSRGSRNLKLTTTSVGRRLSSSCSSAGATGAMPPTTPAASRVPRGLEASQPRLANPPPPVTQRGYRAMSCGGRPADRRLPPGRRAAHVPASAR